MSRSARLVVSSGAGRQVGEGGMVLTGAALHFPKDAQELVVSLLGALLLPHCLPTRLEHPLRLLGEFAAADAALAAHAVLYVSLLRGTASADGQHARQPA